MLAMALGIARLDPPRQWLNQMLVASYSKLEHCRAQELANLVWGFWRLFFKPPQRWLDAVATAASRLTEQGAMSATDLITLGRAFSAFGAELPANVRQALKAAEEAQLLLQMPQQGVEAKRQQLVLGVQQQTGRPQTAGLQPPSSEQGHQQQQPKAMRQRKPPKPNRQEHPDLSFQQRQPQQERRQLEKQLHDPTLDGTQHSGEEAGMQPGVRCVASAAVRGQGLRQQSGREQASERVDNVPGQTSGEQRTNHVIPSAVASSCKPARLLELPSADMARSTGSSGVMEVVVSEHDPVASTTAIAIAASAVAAPEPLATGEAVLSATAAGSEGAGRVITVQGSRAEAGSAETRPRAASGAVRGAIEPVRKEAEAGKQAAAVDQTSAVTKTEVVGMATQSQPVLGSHFRDVLNFATANVHSEAEGVERRREKRRRDRQVKRRLAVRSDGMPAAITDSDAANAGVSDAVTVSSANGDKAAMDSSQLPPTLAESVSPSASLSAPLSLTSPSELPEIPAAQAALPSGNGRVSDMESSASGAASPLPSLSATAAANDFVASGTDSVTCYGTLRVANGSSAVDEARAALEPVEQSIDSLQLVSVSDLGFAELEGHAASPKAASEAADVMPLQTTARATRAAARRRARERALQQQTGAALLPVLE
ncbi:hypothetical protein Vretifemale_6615 [Volvox reticuliferus]|nr:hypothetical protein Vretifemale_6615 [Volvox reticuliferus]